MFSDHPLGLLYVKIRYNSKKGIESWNLPEYQYTADQLLAMNWRDGIAILLGARNLNMYSLDFDGEGLMDFVINQIQNDINNTDDADFIDIMSRVLKSTRFRTSDHRGQILLRFSDLDVSTYGIIVKQEVLDKGIHNNKKTTQIEILGNDHITIIPPSVCTGDSYNEYERWYEVPMRDLQTFRIIEYNFIKKYLTSRFGDIEKTKKKNIGKDAKTHNPSIPPSNPIHNKPKIKEDEIIILQIPDQRVKNIIQIIHESGIVSPSQRHSFSFNFAVLCKKYLMDVDVAIKIIQSLQGLNGGDINDMEKAVKSVYEDIDGKYPPNTGLEWLRRHMDTERVKYFFRLEQELKKIKNEYVASYKEIMNIISPDEPKYITIAKELINEYHTFYHKDVKRFGLYKDGVYVFGDDLISGKIYEKHIHTNTHFINEVKSYIKSQCSLSDDDFQLSTEILNLKNGLYITKENKFIEHTPDHKTLIQYSWGYDAEQHTIPPKTLEFLRSLELHPDDFMNLLQVIRGFITFRLVKEKKFVIFKGPTNSGKSTLINILQKIVGKKLHHPIDLQTLGSDFSSTAIYNKTMISDSDASKNRFTQKMVSALKKLTGLEESIEINKKGIEQFSSKNISSLFIGCNSLPLLIHGDDIGSLAKRLILFEFKKSHNNMDGEDSLIWLKELYNEIPQFCSYLLNLKPIKLLQVPYGITKPIDEYWAYDSDVMLQWLSDNITKMRDNDDVWDFNDVLNDLMDYTYGKGQIFEDKYMSKRLKTYIKKMGGRIKGKMIDRVNYTLITNCHITSAHFKISDAVKDNKTQPFGNNFDGYLNSDSDSYKDIDELSSIPDYILFGDNE